MKKSVITLHVLMLFLLILFVGCQQYDLKDYQNDKKEFNVNDAKKFFENNATNLRNVTFSPETKSDHKDQNLIPNWDKAEITGRNKFTTIEIPLEGDVNRIALLTKCSETNKKCVQNTSVIVKLVVQRHNENGNTRQFVVTMIDDKCQSKNTIKKCYGMSDFSGYVIISSLEGQYLESFQSRNGLWKKVSVSDDNSKLAADSHVTMLSFSGVANNTKSHNPDVCIECCEYCNGAGCSNCLYVERDGYHICPVIVRSCRECRKHPCECCRKCHRYPCQCCSMCDIYPCECCKTCNKFPCQCCSMCHKYPCLCSSNMCMRCYPKPCECFRCPNCNSLYCNGTCQGIGGGGGGGEGGGGDGGTPPPPVEPKFTFKDSTSNASKIFDTLSPGITKNMWKNLEKMVVEIEKDSIGKKILMKASVKKIKLKVDPSIKFDAMYNHDTNTMTFKESISNIDVGYEGLLVHELVHSIQGKDVNCAKNHEIEAHIIQFDYLISNKADMGTDLFWVAVQILRKDMDGNYNIYPNSEKSYPTHYEDVIKRIDERGYKDMKESPGKRIIDVLK